MPTLMKEPHTAKIPAPTQSTVVLKLRFSGTSESIESRRTRRLIRKMSISEVPAMYAANPPTESSRPNPMGSSRPRAMAPAEITQIMCRNELSMPCRAMAPAMMRMSTMRMIGSIG